MMSLLVKLSPTVGAYDDVVMLSLVVKLLLLLHEVLVLVDV